MDHLIIGRKPVTEAVKNGKPIQKILIREGSASGPLAALLQEARDRGIRIDRVPERELDRMAEGHHHQGVVAYTAAGTYTDFERILQAVQEKRKALLVILDEIEDPQNLGAIIRTAECAGASGVILPKRRSAGLSPAAVKASAGATEYIPCARVSNLASAIEELKKRGFWIGCCDMGGDNLFAADLPEKIALVIGNEGRGVGRLIREKCDFALSIPLYGKIESLNASAAAAVVLYEVVRRCGDQAGA